MIRSRLRPVSPKREKLNREYEKAKRTWRANHDGRCEFFEHGRRCTRRAMNQPHHKAGRGRNLCDISTFMGVCFEHHRWIDTHRREAAKLGYWTPQFQAPAPAWTKDLIPL